MATVSPLESAPFPTLNLIIVNEASNSVMPGGGELGPFGLRVQARIRLPFAPHHTGGSVFSVPLCSDNEGGSLSH